MSHQKSCLSIRSVDGPSRPGPSPVLGLEKWELSDFLGDMLTRKSDMCPAVKNFLFLHLLASIGTLYIPVPMEFLPSKGGILLSHVPMYCTRGFSCNQLLIELGRELYRTDQPRPRAFSSCGRGYPLTFRRDRQVTTGEPHLLF